MFCAGWMGPYWTRTRTPGSLPLGGLSPREIYDRSKRVELDRNRIYAEYSALKDRILEEWRSRQPGPSEDAELNAMRIAAYTVLKNWNLGDCGHGPEDLEVFASHP